MFGKQNKQKKVIKKMRKRLETIERLKEEVEKMAKYGLKDGKLSMKKKDDLNVEEVEQQPTQPVQQPMPQQPMPQQPVPSAPVYPQPEMQQPQYQPQMDPQLQQQMAQQMAQQMVQQQAQQIQQEESVVFSLFLYTGENIQFPIPMSEYQKVAQELTEAIADQGAFTIEQKVINGRHIVYFTYQ